MIDSTFILFFSQQIAIILESFFIVTKRKKWRGQGFFGYY
ncbi:hypothetical protein M595_2230 [Lyngbya aestuarii BL J]|uniref:Uncharacterized protein n=1 Tax=Lyngbya aestuarii BL J TaxID=1348334 RepID=U7QN27_9CYAN|nr:hypothetical protein M595_2230 [Lyngbya aestuarii BL J]